MRGEHDGACFQGSRVTGSSPHARGTLAVIKTHAGRLGIIPACAGNTWSDHAHDRGQEDHPRMRGEHQIPSDVRKHCMGSSPHARGTPNLPVCES